MAILCITGSIIKQLKRQVRTPKHHGGGNWKKQLSPNTFHRFGANKRKKLEFIKTRKFERGPVGLGQPSEEGLLLGWWWYHETGSAKCQNSHRVESRSAIRRNCYRNWKQSSRSKSLLSALALQSLSSALYWQTLWGAAGKAETQSESQLEHHRADVEGWIWSWEAQYDNCHTAHRSLWDICSGWDSEGTKKMMIEGESG